MNNMKYFKRKLVALLMSIIVLTSGCSKFGDLNVSPNSASVPLPSALLTDAIYEMSANMLGRSFQTNPTLYVQWLMQTQYPDEAQYSVAQIDWARFYVNPLEDLQKIIDLNTDESTKEYAENSGSNANQLAISRIFKAYTFGLITDMYGDIPYFDALKEQAAATYDAQEDIYKDLIKELTEAVGQFDGGAKMEGDILFGGDASKWKKFANSLRMNYALRLSKRYPGASDYAAVEFNKALNDPAGFIDDNSENAAFTYFSDSKFRNPWNSEFDGRADYAPSATFVDTLLSFEDPRIPVFFEKDGQGGYTGTPYGIKRSDLINWQDSHPDWSEMGASLIEREAPGYIITTAQVRLARAEAAERGWTSESAKQLYESAIEASFRQWGVFDAGEFADYISNPFTEFDTDPLRKIATQKWIALYPNQQFEAWAEWRRTEYPKLTPSKDAVNQSKQIPRRYLYPANEATLNGPNYEAAVSRLSNGDTDDSRTWWDK